LLVWNEDNKPVANPRPSEEPKLAASHQTDFLEAIVDRRKPMADIETAHDSVSLVHLANIALRTGRSLKIDPETETIQGDLESTRLLGRDYRKDHWSTISMLS
jgi:hypothetical protein